LKEEVIPDIAMCRGDGCLMRVKCYRYRAIRNPNWQSIYSQSPLDITTQECDMLLELKSDSGLRLNEKTT